MSKRFVKTVHLAVQGDIFKTIYFDWERETLRPNLVFIRDDGSVFFEINAAGLKGEAIDEKRKLVVVWGDSVVFGVGYSWPRMMEALAPGYQFLNGGIEGDGFNNILRRAAEFNRQYPVTLNIVMLGWHPNWIFSFDESLRPRGSTGLLSRLLGRQWEMDRLNSDVATRLTEFLREFPNTALLTLPTALNESIIDQDLSPLFVEGDNNTGFSFLGRLPYSVEIQRATWRFALERNRITREVCRALNVRVVDLFERFDSRRESDFRSAFHDILHFRIRTFPSVAETVHSRIKDLLSEG